MRFIGRRKELEILGRLHAKKTSSLAVVWGRRRVGKTRLIDEFLKGKTHWSFIGNPPVQTISCQDQLDIFTGQMSRMIGMPRIQAKDWGEVFWLLGNQAKNQKKLVIVFDEISWMGSLDKNFLGHLKSEWDRTFSKHPNLILILCGSVSSWIEKNILSSTGFLGRVSVKLELQELPLFDCNKFWTNKRISAFEKLKILSVTGGIPKYLEEIVPDQTAEKNISHLCFSEEGFLFSEYKNIFSDLFDQRAPTFDNIIRSLATGAKNLNEICLQLKIKKSGFISSYLHELIMAGFVAEDKTWNIKSKIISNLTKFRLKDNYLRFYLKFIEPNKTKIEQGKFPTPSLEQLTGWHSIIALQFENLVLNNRKKICDILGIDGFETAGPFFQRHTKRGPGCQIDLMIQTKFNVLYICEIKFSIQEVNVKVIQEVEEKIQRLKYPKGYSIRPVLIHVNGVNERVLEEDFFAQVIDFSELLTDP